jgi:HIV Tat-specific factor 1
MSFPSSSLDGAIAGTSSAILPLYAPPESLLASTPAPLTATKERIRKTFDQEDERVYFDKQSGNWRCEIEGQEGSDEVEWEAQTQAWVPVLNEEAIKAQQAAYSVEGVDEEVS